MPFRLHSRAVQSSPAHEEGEVWTELAQPFEVLLGDDLTAEAKAVLASANGPQVRVGPSAWEKPSYTPTEAQGSTCAGRGLKVSLMVGAEGLEPPTSAM